MSAPSSQLLPPGGRLLGAPAASLIGRRAIEDCLAGMNEALPAARRRVHGPHAGDAAGMHLLALPMPERGRPGGDTFMVEVQSSVALDVQTLDLSCAPAAYSVCVPVAGEMALRRRGAEVRARAGEALFIDPVRVELTQLMPGTHFIEFNLPKAQFLRLGAELQAGAVSGHAEFAPLLPPDLSRRLSFMAVQAGRSLQAQAPGPRRSVMFQRWLEMLALTLLDEHGLGQPQADLLAPQGGTPASLKRALDFIDAHAADEILMADIAAASFVSASGLLRLFKAHLGESPGAYLRRVRLDRARLELGRGDAGAIKELALRWGFQSASKFSLAYRQRFGELPTETRSARLRSRR